MRRGGPGNSDYAPDAVGSMADSESDLETDGLELALDTLSKRYCRDVSSPNSKDFCSEFCELVEEYTGQWQVPLPQLKVLRTALCSFTKASAAFPDDCQHVHYVLSSLALSFFELMLFFSREEFGEKPLKEILECYQECHCQLLRHRNVYLQHVKQIIKAGGPWENAVLQGILKEKELPPKEVEGYLSSELPVFLELRVRYLQACERIQEAMALAKGCLESRKAGKHLYFHQAYLTCLYKASLHEHLHKEMAEIDGRDAVEIICNTEQLEKDELLLSLCKAFLTQQLHNGDMYYIWDLVFIWSRLHLRAHPPRQAFLAECLRLASSATNVRAIFPFIKLVTTELGADGVQVCVELCARALHLCDAQAHSVTQSLVCKTIAFLLPHDLEICRACALLVFCQERSLEAYRTVCLLYMHPDQEPHPHNSPVKTSVRFHILQMLKERLCFDPEFWNLLTLRTHCLELISDTVMKDAVLNEMKEEEQYTEQLLSNSAGDSPHTRGSSPCKCAETALENQNHCQQTEEKKTRLAPSINPLLKKRRWGRRLRRKERPASDEELDVADDPEFRYNLKPSLSANKPMYSLRRYQSGRENSTSMKLPLNRKREYLSRCVKSQILKRKGRKKRWLQGLPRLEPLQAVIEKKVQVTGKKRGRKPLQKWEISYPDNEISVLEVEPHSEEKTHAEETAREGADPQRGVRGEAQEVQHGKQTDRVCATSPSGPSGPRGPRGPSTQSPEEREWGSDLSAAPEQALAAAEAESAVEGPLLELYDCPVEAFHSYALKPKKPDGEPLPPPPPPPTSAADSDLDEVNGDTEPEPQLSEDVLDSGSEVKGKKSWRDRALRTQKYAHLVHNCRFCGKNYKGLNVIRHALSHLKSGRLRCILCGKGFKQLLSAKKHIREHMEDMCKHKAPDEPPHAQTLPALNGTAAEPTDQNRPPEESQTSASASASNQESSEQKAPAKTKVSSLRREDRIIRNLRTLIKKTAVVQKKSKNPNSDIFKLVDFKDEQVLIKEGLVVIKGASLTDTEHAAALATGGAQEPAPAQAPSVDITCHLCPSASCDRVFLRLGSTLTKHAIRWHMDEDHVLEKTYVWAKHKCSICFRQLQFLLHYKDHMKRHNSPRPFFCYHLECKESFATAQELKEHVGAHRPFRPQCPFPDCEKLFVNIQAMYDHEWRHYIPVPQRDELEVGPSRPKSVDQEAPWKQRLKVEEAWLQGKKARSPTGNHAESWSPDHPGEAANHRGDGDGDDPEDAKADNSESGDGSGSESRPPARSHLRASVNGFEDVSKEWSEAVMATLQGAGAGTGPDTPRKRRSKRPPVEVDPLNVKDLEDMSTLSEGVQQRLGEPHITEHKSFRPEDPSYAPFVKAPFIRPPPSTYLDESLLSMRKRRSADDSPPKKHLTYVSKKKREGEAEAEAQPQDTPEHKVRQRCSKCLSSFSNGEELQKHRAQNSCSALFGFDSDDES